MNIATEILAPVEDVWTLLIDTQRWPEWGPTVRAVESPERFIRLGTKGWVRTPLGFWVPFEITEFEPLRQWRWRVVGVPATGHRVEALGDGRTRLVFELPAIAFPYAAVCRIAGLRIARMAEQKETENGRD